MQYLSNIWRNTVRYVIRLRGWKTARTISLGTIAYQALTVKADLFAEKAQRTKLRP